MNISLKQIRVFVAVSQNQSITQAAATLCLTKAAVSMALSELENQLGQSLFDRVHNRLHLNEQGKQLLPLADELLQRTHSISSLFTPSGKLQGTLKIGASETVGNQICPWLIAAFRQQKQHEQQTLFIGNSAAICDKILNYQLDIGLIEGSADHPSITVIPWISDEMCIICASEDPLAQLTELTISDLSDRAWLLREHGSGSRAFFNQNLASQLDGWHVAYELNSVEAQLNFTAAGLGLACVSRLSAVRAIADRRVCILPLKHSLQRQYKLLLHKERFQSELITEFINFCQQWTIKGAQ